MSNKYITKFIFLLLLNTSYLISTSQLTTFFEDWEPRTFNNFTNIDLKPELNSAADVVVNINTSNIIADVLPSHFGTNMTHFLGQSVINDNDFMSNLKNLGKTILRYPGGNGSNQFFWDGNIPSSILNDSQISINDLIDGSGWRISPDEFLDILDSTNGSYDSGIDEAYALKVNLNTDSQWHKYNYSFSSFVIDQSGNNILVDGILNPQNIIRIDITNSQSGSANGQFGYFADYFLITYNEPL